MWVLLWVLVSTWVWVWLLCPFVVGRLLLHSSKGETGI